MAERRKYTKRQKLSAVMAAEMVGVTMAGEQSGIPKTTIQYWLDRPEFAPFRTKTREDLMEEVKTVAHLAWTRVGEALAAGTLEPRDALFAADKATSYVQLLGGSATVRIETSDVGDILDDHERIALRKAIDAELAKVPV